MSLLGTAARASAAAAPFLPKPQKTCPIIPRPRLLGRRGDNRSRHQQLSRYHLSLPHFYNHRYQNKITHRRRIIRKFMKRDECDGTLHETAMRQALWRSKCYIANTSSHLVLVAPKDTDRRKNQHRIMRRD